MLTYHMFNKVEEACGTIFDWNTTCEIVKSCSNANTIINYNYLFHCSLNGSLASIVIICLILLFLFFYSLYYSSEYFLATPLQRLVVYFNIDGPIAGVTLLSFANGAPDFFTSIAGGDGGDSNSGLNLVIGSVLGSGMFTTCLVFAVGLLAARPKTRSEGELSELVIINQTENESNKKIYSWIHAPRGFLVNLFIYCFGVSLVLAMCISRSVFIFYGLALICIYLLYLTFVIFPKVKGFLKPFHRNFYKSQTYPPQNIPQIVIQGSKENIVVPSNNEDILASPSNCIECQQQPNSLGIEDITKNGLSDEFIDSFKSKSNKSNIQSSIQNKDNQSNSNSNYLSPLSSISNNNNEMEEDYFSFKNQPKLSLTIPSINISNNNTIENLYQNNNNLLVPQPQLSPSPIHTTFDEKFNEDKTHQQKEEKDINKIKEDKDDDDDMISKLLYKYGIQIQRKEKIKFYGFLKLFYYNQSISLIYNKKKFILKRISNIVKIPVILLLRITTLPSFTDWVLIQNEEEELNYREIFNEFKAIKQLTKNNNEQQGPLFTSPNVTIQVSKNDDNNKIHTISSNFLRYIHRLLSSTPRDIHNYRIALSLFSPFTTIAVFFNTSLMKSNNIIEPLPNLALATILGLILASLMYLITLPLSTIANVYRMEIYNYLLKKYPEKSTFEKNSSLKKNKQSSPSPRTSLSPSPVLLEDIIVYPYDDIIELGPIEDLNQNSNTNLNNQPELERQRSWVSTFNALSNKSIKTSIYYPKYKAGFRHLLNFLSEQREVPMQHWIYYSMILEWTLTLIGMATSIIWINNLSNMLVEVIMFLSHLFNVKESFLGMTLLAWGNSVSDLVVGASMAKAGLPQILLTSAIAGPIFNMLITLGVTLIEVTVKGQSLLIPLTLDSMSFTNMAAFCFLFCNLISIVVFTTLLPSFHTLLFSRNVKFETVFPKFLPYYQIILYVLFLVTITLVEFLT